MISSQKNNLAAARATTKRLRSAILAAGISASFVFAQHGAPQAAAAGNNAPNDFASEQFSDPWDYNNAEDIVIADDGPMRGVSNASISGGQLHGTMSGPGYISPLWGGYGGSLLQGREGGVNQVDTSRFTHLAFKLTSTAATEIPAGIFWYSCPDGRKNPIDMVLGNCEGGQPIFIKPGTHTYDIPLANSEALKPGGKAWSGKMSGIRLALSPSSPMTFDLDWISLAPQGATPDGNFGPLPEVIDPDVTGGADYATTVGDAWDMNEASDVLRADNATGGVSGGFFNGTNAGATPIAREDSSITMKVRKAINGNAFHRLTVGYTYSGPFRLQHEDGGGTMSRVIWRVAGTPSKSDGTDLQNSDDLVTYPNQPQFSIDLHADDPKTITDDAQAGPRIGWSNQSIEYFRFDPNEDTGNRKWKVDFVKLAADDAADKTFKIRWKDNAGGGGTADLYADTDRDGFNGTPIAQGIAVKDGENSFDWTPSAPGSYWVYAVHHRDGKVGRAYATGPVTIGKGGLPSDALGGCVGGVTSALNAKPDCGGDAPSPAQNALALKVAVKASKATKKPTTKPAKSVNVLTAKK